MLQSIRRSWGELRRGRPGRRFQTHYERRQQKGSGRVRKVAFIGVGLLIMTAGIVALPAPGPGLLIIILGAGLVAEESLWTAKLLDRLERGSRSLLAWGKRFWRRTSLPGRVLLVTVGAAAAGALAFGAWELVLAR